MFIVQELVLDKCSKTRQISLSKRCLCVCLFVCLYVFPFGTLNKKSACIKGNKDSYTVLMHCQQV